MPEGPLGLPRPFAEEFDRPLFILVEIDSEEHQSQFEDPEIDTMNIKKMNETVNNLADMGIAINKQTSTIISQPPNTILFTIELAVTNLDIQGLEDIRNQVTRILGYRNTVISTVPATGMRRFR